MLIWGGTLRSTSQATRLHFYFLSDFSEVISVLLSISPKWTRHLCFKSLIIPKELHRASLCTAPTSQLEPSPSHHEVTQFCKTLPLATRGRMDTLASQEHDHERSTEHTQFPWDNSQMCRHFLNTSSGPTRTPTSIVLTISSTIAYVNGNNQYLSVDASAYFTRKQDYERF